LSDVRRVSDAGSPDILGSLLRSLLSRLKFLEWLHLHADRVDAALVAVFNSHLHLHTVAVHDPGLNTLTSFAPSTSFSLSKILIDSAILNCTLTLQSPALLSLMSRSPRVAHLILRGACDVKVGAGPVPARSRETRH
jgi:hypothetical protein